MGPRSGDTVDDSTPEDVAALYRWAGLTGAKYRDYSAERREQRAQTRYRLAKEQLERELGQPDESGEDAGGKRARGTRLAGTATRAVLRAMEEQREVAEAQESARRKQDAFEKAERQLRERTGPKTRADFSEILQEKPRADAVEHIGTLIAAVPVPQSVQEATERSLAGIRPAWLRSDAQASETDAEKAPTFDLRGSTAQVRDRSQAAETLFESREHVALRWPALQAMAQALRLNAATVKMSGWRGPVAAIVSPSGGSGATSVTATLARALAARGERVLAVDAAEGMLLPVYFGAGPFQRGETRDVKLPESGAVSLYAMDMHALAAMEGREQARASSIEELLRRAQGFDRVVIDIAQGEEWLVRGLAELRPLVLAPVAPELNAIAGLSSLERTFAGILDPQGWALLPFYVLNRFDAGLPLHLDVREVLRRELGERMLAGAVRRSAAVGEALAEGKTVLDYAPDSPVAADYAEVARWMTKAAPASAGMLHDAARGLR